MVEMLRPVPLLLHVWLFHGRGDFDALRTRIVVVFASVHTALALLSNGARLGSQIDAQLSAFLLSCVVLRGRR